MEGRRSAVRQTEAIHEDELELGSIVALLSSAPS
jgi:hypothetical protein